MNCQRWVARAVLLIAVAAGALSTTSAAPVPTMKPREGTIVLGGGYGGTPRLFRTDGTVLGELPFEDVWNCVLSPDGRRAAVLVRILDPNRLVETNRRSVLYVIPIGGRPDDIGLPIATVHASSFVAWGGNTKLYFSEYLAPLRRDDFVRPDHVTVYDFERKTATEDKALRGYRILELSVDGKLLLAQRFVAKPAERWEFVLLDAATGKLVNSGLGELSALRFDGPDGLLGSRENKGAPNDAEWISFDLTTKRAVPLKLPKEVTADTARVLYVMSSPDRSRLLYVWREELPPPTDWPAGLRGPLYATRLTTCDRDGGNARTIFKPEIKTREDEARNDDAGIFDWR